MFCLPSVATNCRIRGIWKRQASFLLRDFCLTVKQTGSFSLLRVGFGFGVWGVWFGLGFSFML